MTLVNDWLFFYGFGHFVIGGSFLAAPLSCWRILAILDYFWHFHGVGGPLVPRGSPETETVSLIG